MDNKPRNKKLGEDAFYAIQKEVLAQWPTGKDVNFKDAVEYHKTIPASKSFSLKLAAAKKNAYTLIQPRAGVPLPEKHIESSRFRIMFFRLPIPPEKKEAGPPPFRRSVSDRSGPIKARVPWINRPARAAAR